MKVSAVIHLRRVMGLGYSNGCPGKTNGRPGNASNQMASEREKTKTETSERGNGRVAVGS